MTYEQFRELALLKVRESENKNGIDKFTAQERCEYYFNNGWQMALVVARSGAACDDETTRPSAGTVAQSTQIRADEPAKR